MEQTKPLRKSVQLFVSFDLNTWGQPVSKGTVSNWPSASMSHYCASARRELEGASGRSAIKAVAGAAASLGSVLQSHSVCRFLSIFTKHYFLDIVAKRCKVWGPLRSGLFLNWLSNSFSPSPIPYVCMPLSFSKPVLHIPCVLLPSCSTWADGSLLKMRTNGKSKASQRSIPPGGLFYRLPKAYSVHTDSKTKCKAN